MVRRFQYGLALFACLSITTSALAQGPRGGRTDTGFEKAKPAVGEKLPELTVLDPTGKEVNLKTLRGSYSVITFGCLT